jgi:hypothetical protein
MQMRKIALIGAVVSVLVMAGGCASRYDDGYYDNNGSYSRYHDRDHRWRDRHDRDDWRDRGDTDRRVRVCDADGSDCHWEYRGR